MLRRCHSITISLLKAFITPFPLLNRRHVIWNDAELCLAENKREEKANILCLCKCFCRHLDHCQPIQCKLAEGYDAVWAFDENCRTSEQRLLGVNCVC